MSDQDVATSTNDQRYIDRVATFACAFAYVNAVAYLCLFAEEGETTSWSLIANNRWLWVWVTLAPIFWFWRISWRLPLPRFLGRIWTSIGATSPWKLKAPSAFLIAMISFLVSWRTSHLPFSPDSPCTFANSPPLIHDEYSYLFQADTYLLGRLYNPSHPTMPELFDTMHVLNEGKFVSRYFPGTGAWIVPFRLLGWPELGHWVASAIICVLVFFVGCELEDHLTGLIAGLLTACSPGMAIFSNLLLAHQPTLVGLMVAMLGIVRLPRTRSYRDAFMAGTGLGYGLLCRPLTAAAWGLALLIWFQFQKRMSLTSQFSNGIPRATIRLLAATCTPVALAAGFQAFCNQQITGDWWTTPYTQYQEIYSPNQRYGFDNVKRGATIQSDKILLDYNDWAENLTLPLALKRADQRLLSSTGYALTTFVLTIVTCLMAALTIATSPRYLLFPMLLFSLHAIHFGYWFLGILGWHYVFETLPIWELMTAWVTIFCGRSWQGQLRKLMVMWWEVLIIASVASTILPFPQNVTMASGLNQLSFQARRYEQYNAVLIDVVKHRPAIVLVAPGPKDLHVEYVLNHPSLADPVIYGRMPTEPTQLERVGSSWPDRWVYLIQMSTGSGRLSSTPRQDSPP